MQINGRIFRIGKTQQVSDNFSKREFVLETEFTTQYPQMILLEFTNNKCELLDKYSEEQEVSVDFNLRGRNWVNKEGEVKTFVTLQAWKIEAVGGGSNQTQTNKPTNTTPVNTTPVNNDDNSDLPF